MKLRTACLDDLDEIYSIEKICFPPQEQIKKDYFEQKLQVCPESLWILEDNSKIVSFISTITTNCRDLKDEMYTDIKLYDKNGAWRMILDVNTLPEYRGKGLAGKLLNYIIEEAKKENRSGMVLVCKESLITFYETFGFVYECISESTLGNTTWHQMRLSF